MDKVFLFTIFLVLACTSTRDLVNRHETRPSSEKSLRLSIATDANHFIGTEYRYGGMDQSGLDCSGLVYTIFKSHAFNLPRSSSEQMKVGRRISAKAAQVGDLVFFKQNGRINHVAIVTAIKAGDLWVTHSTTSRGVIRESLNDSSYWSSRVEGVRDIISISSK